MRSIVLGRKAAALAAFVLVGCGGAGSGISATQDRQINIAFPGAGNFVAGVTNTYFPLTPKKVYHFRSDTGDGIETGRTEVTSDTKTILGVACTVVHDQVFTDGELSEDTFDWYAQDSNGKVWYFGENSHEIENGVPVSSHGSWEAGVDGATPGIVMLAHPKIGDKYRQEFLKDVAEDEAKVVSLKKTVNVPAGAYANCRQTMDWTHLEPGAREFKYYAPGFGVVLEVDPAHSQIRNELISIETLP